MRSGNPRALRFPRARVRDVDVRCPRLRRRVAADFAERLGGQTIIAARRGAVPSIYSSISVVAGLG